MYTSERIDDKINKECGEELGINPELVDKVIRFQFRTANEACSTSTSVELTDLGVFKATKTKLDRKLKTFNRKLEFKQKLSQDPNLSDRKRRATLLTCNTIEENIVYLENKRKSYED